MRITRKALDEVRRHASDGYPTEVCGALIATRGRRIIHQARRLRNTVGARARDRYEVDVNEQRRLMRECDDAGWEIVGYYHSHPDHPAWASEADAKRSWARTVYLIVSCVGGETVDGNAFVAAIDGGPLRQVSLRVVG